MRNAYLVMTDLHLDFTKANRIDYFGEILDAMTAVLKIAGRYKDAGYALNLIFLGDVFDGSITNASEALQAREVMQFFCGKFDKVWSVVGNHEITYATDNPFWFMVTEIRDESLSRIRRFIQPRGLNNTIAIPDKIVDGNCILHFNHFGTPAKTPTDPGVNIGLFHQNVGSNDICKMWGTFDNVEDAAYIRAYNYCFFGHMHLAKGKFYLNESHTCQGEWLGCIGRTKVDEILDDSLEVNVPCVLVEDGKFNGIEDNYISLKPAKDCIDYAKLNATNKSKKVIEEQRATVATGYKGDTLFKTLEGSFEGSGFAYLLRMLSGSWDDVYYTYSCTLRDIAEPPAQSTEDSSEGDSNNG